MSPRAPIIAGKTVIVVQVQDAVDQALTTIKGKLRRFSNSIGNVGLDLFRGGLLGTLPTGLLLKDFKDFEDKILFLSTKLTATDAEFKLLTETIRELGKTTSFTASEVADGATVLAQAGLNAREVMDTLQPTLDLARGAQITLSQAGEILANTMRSFSMETKNAGVVASQFIAAARLGTLDVLDLKESIKEVLGTVRNLNIDLPTTLALLTQMASRSLKGTKAGTSLNTALLQLASKSQVLAQVFKINLGDNINGDRFITFLEELYEKLLKMGNLKRTAVLQNIFNIRGGRAITALDDIKAIIELRKQIAGAENEARKAAVTMDSGFGGALRRAGSALNDLSITLGQIVAGPLGTFAEMIPPLTASLEQLAKVNPNLVLTLIAIPPAMLAIGAATLVLSYGLGKLSTLVGVLLGGFRLFGSQLNNVLTVNLIKAYQATRLLRGGLRGIDTRLSAALLPPQRATRGRSAGKVIPTSFVGRVSQLSTAGFGARVAGNLNRVETGLGRLQRTATRRAGLNILGLLGGGRAGRTGLSAVGTTSNVMSSVAKGLFTGLRALTRVDVVRNLYTIFSMTGRIAFGFLRAANAVRRFVFSFGGITLIIEALLLFGPKIKFIREAFERLGKGIKGAFSELGGIFTSIGNGPAGLFKAGLGQLFSGEGDLGIRTISDSLVAMSNIIGNQLTAAWATFVEAIAPAYDYMRKLISSTIELGKLFLDTFGVAGAQLGNVLKVTTGTGGKEAGSGIGGLLKQVFNPESIKSGFLAIGSILTGIAQTIATAINKISTVILDTMIMIQDAILALLGSKFASSYLDVDHTTALSMTTSNIKSKALSKSLNKDLNDSLENIQARFEKFGASLDEVFKKDTEVEARTKKWKAIQETMGDEWLATIKMTGEGITDVFAQVRHAQQYPNTSIFASRSAFSGTAQPGGTFLNNGAGRVGKPIPVMAVNPATNKPVPVPSPTVQAMIQDSMNTIATLNSGTLQGIGPQGKQRFGASLRDLQEEALNQAKIQQVSPSPENKAAATQARKALAERQKQIRDEQERLKLLKLQDRMQALAAKGLGPRMMQMGSIKDVVAATVGDIQSTRLNKLKAVGNDPQQQANVHLTNIATALGAPGTPYLQQILNKATPLVLQ